MILFSLSNKYLFTASTPTFAFWRRFGTPSAPTRTRVPGTTPTGIRLRTSYPFTIRHALHASHSHSCRSHTLQLGLFISECPHVSQESDIQEDASTPTRGSGSSCAVIMRGEDLAHFPHHPLSDLIWRTIEVRDFFFPLRWHVAHQLRPLTLHLLVGWIPHVVLSLLLTSTSPRPR